MNIYQNNFLPTDMTKRNRSGQRRNGDGYTFYKNTVIMTKDGVVRTEPAKMTFMFVIPTGW